MLRLVYADVHGSGTIEYEPEFQPPVARAQAATARQSELEQQDEGRLKFFSINYPARGLHILLSTKFRL